MIKLLLISFLIFTSCKKEEDFNPYLEEGNKSVTVNSPKYLYQLHGEEVGGKNIPKELGITKYKEDLKHYLKYYNAVESFAIRMNYKKERNLNDFQEENNNAPSLTQLFEDEITDKQVEEFIAKNADKFSDPNIPIEQKKASAKYELLVELITPRYLKKRKELYDAEKLHINILPPDFRKTGIFFGGYPRLGKKENKLELMVITNYLCEDCRTYNEQITNLYKKYGKSLSYVHVYHAFRPGTLSHDTILAGHCLNLIDPKKYWRFHKMMYDSPVIGGLGLRDREKFKGILKSYAKELGVEDKRLFSCMAEPENIKVINGNILSFGDAGITRLPLFYLNGRQLILLEKEGLEAAFKNMSKTLGIK